MRVLDIAAVFRILIDLFKTPFMIGEWETSLWDMYVYTSVIGIILSVIWSDFFGNS